MPPLCRALASVTRMRPFISFTWSSSIWLSTSTSMSGKLAMRGCMFFILEARPTIFCGMRLHIESHCSSRSSCVNCSFSSLFVTSASFFAATASLRCRLWKVMPSDDSLRRGPPAADFAAEEAIDAAEEVAEGAAALVDPPATDAAEACCWAATVWATPD